ncbi:sulfotransferase family protein [Celeribacter litoreus]|uniref:sulfotransferase family protein n=1 Tax=Celeribacter litoreus TaxID=2876714 RepID=UPI001CCE3A7B|nr:sulfotransferase [Celeribacter litoreus]MCA0045081.1 sulfotransferase [Celeribacter litoreus]
MKDRKPLIILTCMRSYSSLVSSMLGQHSGLYTLPEINPFVETTLGRFERRANMVRPRTLDGLYRAVAEIEYGNQTEKSVKKAIEWTRERAGWTIVDAMNHLADQVAPRRVIDKSPSTVLSDDAINRAITTCPDAYFLHLYRHPCATTKSIAKITKFGSAASTGGKDPEDAWYSSNLRIMKAASRIPQGQFMSLRGEDVLRDPDNYLTQICTWMGLETTKDDLAAMRHPEKSPYACLGPRSAPFGNDPNFLRNPAYSQREIPERPLSDPLDWDREDRYLNAETVAISHQLGYGP